MSTTFQAIRKLRYVLFAGTLMSALAVPQWSFACPDEYGPVFVVQNDKQAQKGPPLAQQSVAPPAQTQRKQQAQPSQQQKSYGNQPSGRSSTSDY